MSTFKVTYPLGEEMGKCFAEIDMEIVVSGPNDIEVFCYDFILSKDVEVLGYFRDMVISWVMSERSCQLNDAMSDVKYGRTQYDREIAQ